MANDTRIQLQKTIEMRETVKSFAAILTQKMNNLEDTLAQYVNAGFPEDIAETYHGYYYTPDRAIIDELSKDMITHHVDFLNRVIADLQGAGDEK